MKILLIGGNHPRHLYYSNKIHEIFGLAGTIIQAREHIIPSPPSYLSKDLSDLFVKHFYERDKTEENYFQKPIAPQCPTLIVSAETINTNQSVTFIKEINPEIVVIFGSTMIRDPLYSALPPLTINLHLGLSPRYRGSATLFWPFYFLEPQYAGSTFHYIVSEPDAGAIVHQVTPTLCKGDGIHDVACKTVIESADAICFLIEKFLNKKDVPAHKQKTSGKNFLNSDFKPQHLRMIYEVYDNKIVDRYLDGEIPGKMPQLVRCTD